MVNSWTERIILEGIRLIQAIILTEKNGLDLSVVTGYVAPYKSINK